MEKKVEKKENCKSIINFKVDGNEWATEIEKAYKKLERKVTVPGFRKGKAPQNLVRAKIATDEVMNEALNSFLMANYEKTLNEEKLNPIMRPEISVSKISLEEVELAIVVIEAPSVNLGEYKNIKVEKSAIAVSEADVEHELKHLQEKNAEVSVKESGVVENGNVATIDFEGFVDGVAFDGGKAEKYDLEIGSNSFIPGFEDQIVGMKAGEEKDIDVKFPENYAPQLAGKDATFKIKLHEVKEKVLPEINDDLALDANLEGVSNLAELKEFYKKQITEHKEKEANDAALNKLMDIIVKNAEFVVADEIVEDEANHQLEDIKHQLSHRNMTLESYLEMVNMTNETLMTKLKDDALRNLKYAFIIMKIAEVEKINVSKEDLEKAYEDISKMYGMGVDDVRKALGNREDGLKRDLLNQKVVEFLKESNSL
jgi:trigger factor